MNKWLPLIFSVLFLSACGGSTPNNGQKPADDDRDTIINAEDNCPNIANKNQLDSDGDGIGDACEVTKTLKEKALQKISEYAKSKGTSSVPTVKDYIDAQVVGVTNETLPKVNQKVSQLTESDVDTDAEIQAILKDLNISTPASDFDGDGIKDTVDNCPGHPNPNQKDSDNDSSGDVCDLDNDNDGILDTVDNCPLISNRLQKDSNKNGVGDACDTGSSEKNDDTDGDGVKNSVDNCPVKSNTNQSDVDNDSIGDACDDDIDGDNVANSTDNCPTKSNPDQADTDNDGKGDACDAIDDQDDDQDGIKNSVDNCPAKSNPDQADTDNDGKGDVCDSTSGVNSAPIAKNQNLTINEDSTKEITLSATDEDNDSLEYIITEQPQNGTLTDAETNWVYTPNENFNGSDGFKFKVNDGKIDSNVASVSITVSPVNDDPTADAGTYKSIYENQTITLQCSGSDIDGTIESYQWLQDTTVVGNTQSYTTEKLSEGNYTYSCKITDNDGAVVSDTTTVSVLPNKDMKRFGNGTGGSFYGMFGLSDHKTMFVTGDMGGLSRSEDAGQTWQLVSVENPIPYTTNEPTSAPLIITEHPDDPDVLFGFKAYSLFLSLDRGKTWKFITSNATHHSRGMGIVEYGGKKYLMIGMGYQNLSIPTNAAYYYYLAAVAQLPDVDTIKRDGIASLTHKFKLITPDANIKKYFTGFKVGGDLPVFGGPLGGVWVVNGNPIDKNAYINVTSHISELKDHLQEVVVDDAVVDGDDLYIIAGGLAGKDSNINETNTTAGIYHMSLSAIQGDDFTYTKIAFDGKDIKILRGFDGFGSKVQKSKVAGAAVLHTIDGVKYIYYLAASDIAFRYRVGDTKIENIFRTKGAIVTKNGYEYVLSNVITPKKGVSWVDSNGGSTYGIDRVVVDGEIKKGVYKQCNTPSVSGTNLMSSINGKLYIANIAEIKVLEDDGLSLHNFTSDVGSVGSYMDGVTVEMTNQLNGGTLQNVVNNSTHGSDYKDRLNVSLPDNSNALTYFSTAITNKNISNMVSTDVFYGDGKDMIETYMDAQSYYSPDDGKSWYWIPGGDAKLNDANFSFKAKDGNYYISERYGLYKFKPVDGDRSSFRKISIDQYKIWNMVDGNWWGENMSESKTQKFAYDKTSDTLVFNSFVNQQKQTIVVITNFTNPSISTVKYFKDVDTFHGKYKAYSHRTIHWFKIVGKDVYFASGEYGVSKFNIDNMPSDFADSARLTTKIGRSPEDKNYWSSASVVDGNTVISSLYNPNSVNLAQHDESIRAYKSLYYGDIDAKVIKINLETGQSEELLRPENIRVNGVHPLVKQQSRRFDILYKKGDDLIGAFTTTTLWLYSHDGGVTWDKIKDIPIGGRYTLPGAYPKAVPQNRGGGYILTFAFTAARFWF